MSDPDLVAQNINSFDQEDPENESTPEVAEREVDFIMRQISLASGASVLDIPCGEGHHSNVFADKYHLNVTGIDGGPTLIDRAKKRYEKVHFFKAYFGDLTNQDLVLDNSQDAVVCINNSFGYLPTVAENEAFLRNMFNKLKPGGSLVIHSFPSYPKVEIPRADEETGEAPVESRLPDGYVLSDESFRTLKVNNRVTPNGLRVKYANYNVMSEDGNAHTDKKMPTDLPIIRALARHAGIDDRQITFHFEAPDNCAIIIQKPAIDTSLIAEVRTAAQDGLLGTIK
jgi:SAM-dependent methyltransferase